MARKSSGASAPLALYSILSHMPRFLATVALLALTAVPVTRVICEWTCADEAAISTSQSCHEQQRDETPRLSVGADHCDGTNVAVVLKARLTDGLGAPRPGFMPIEAAPETRAPSLDARNSFSTSRTPADRLIPLRI